MAIDIVVDTNAAVTAINRLNAAQVQLDSSLAAFNSTTTQFNRLGKVSEQTTQQQINATQDLIKTTTQAANGNKTHTAEIRTTADAIRALTVETQKLKAATNNATLSGLFDLRGLDTAAVGKIEKLRTTILGLNTLQVSPAALTKFFNEIKTGNIPQATGDLARLRDAYVSYFKVVNGAASANVPKIEKPNEIKNGGLPGPDNGAVSRLGDYQQGLDRVVTSLKYLAIFRISGGIQNAFGKAIQDARDYQIQVSLIRTISQEAQLSTGQWAKEIGNLASFLGVDFKDAASATYDAISNQVAQGRDALKFVAEAGQFARATNSTLKDSTNLFSSIQNTYGSEAGTTAEVAAKLFATVDRGRIVANELANTFGRVAFSAKDVGLKFEDVTGTLANLTRAGVTTDDAITLLNNLVQQVSKPSVEMKAYLESIGIAASENAFRILGFDGAIKQLKKGINEGKISSQEIFPEIRAQRAFAKLSSDPKGLAEDIKYTGQTDNGVYARALEIRAESAADKLAKISKSFQNTLANSIGTGFNDVLAGTFEKISGLNLSEITKDAEGFAAATGRVENTLNRVARVAVTTVAAYVAFKTAIVSVTAVQEIGLVLDLRKQLLDTSRQAFQVRGIALNRAEALSVAGLNTAKRASLLTTAISNPLLGVVAVTAAATVAYVAYKNAVIESNSEAAASVNDYLANLDKLKEAKALQGQLDVGKELRKEFEETSKVLSGQIQGALEANNRSLEKTQALSKAAGAELGLKFAGGLNIARGALQKLEQEYAQFDTRIKNSVKSVASFKDKLDEIAFSVQQKYATPTQSIQLDQNRIQTLITQIRQLYAANTDESVAEARTLFDKVGQLQAEVFNKRTDARVAQAPGGSVVQVDISPLLQKQADLIALKVQYEDAYRASVTKTHKEIEVQKGKEVTRIADLEKAVKEFDNFSIKTSDGQVKREYQDANGKISPQKVQADLDRVIKNITDKFPAEVIKSLDLARDINNRRKLAEKEVEETKTGLSLKDKQNEVANLPTKLGAAQADLEKTVKENDVLLKNSGKILDEALKNLAETLKDAPKRLRNSSITDDKETKLGIASAKLADATGSESLRGIAGDFIRGLSVIDEAINNFAGRTRQNPEGLGRAANEINPAPASEAKRLDLLARQASLEQKLKEAQTPSKDINGTKVIDPAKISELITELGKFKADTVQYFREAIKERGITDAKGTPFTGNDVTLNPAIVGEARQPISRIDELVAGLRETEATAKTNLDKIVEADKVRQDILKQTKTLQDAASQASQGLTPLAAAAGGAGLAVINLGKAAGDAAAALAEIKKAQDPATLNKQLNDKGIGSQGRAYGGPIGSDDLIYKRNDEFVSNSSATSQNYSQLANMNNEGRVPQTFTNNNSFTINESKTPGMTADAVMSIIARSQRTGRG